VLRKVGGVRRTALIRADSPGSSAQSKDIAGHHRVTCIHRVKFTRGIGSCSIEQASESARNEAKSDGVLTSRPRKGLAGSIRPLLFAGRKDEVSSKAAPATYCEGRRDVV
jgi:hypothetical protein